ncbi:MAG: SMC-Scp complex subunit ScpB [Butyrivibrio sp.]|nr:SMC-Scp complex subunit ScpB [Butyrivibrio sp.]
MSIERMEAVIEAVLFTMGDSVETAKLALAIEQDKDTTRRLVHNMMDKYEAEGRGIKIIELEDSFQLCTKAEFYENLIKVAAEPKRHVLSDSALETLSIIAYKQPVTKLEIEQIRGVKSDYSVNKLIEYNLITELGRLDAPGRPILFGTTEDFLRSFGLTSVEELPTISPDKLADFRVEAEEETQIKLEI